jgi:hypothetical protein
MLKAIEVCDDWYPNNITPKSCLLKDSEPLSQLLFSFLATALINKMINPVNRKVLNNQVTVTGVVYFKTGSTTEEGYRAS